MAEQSSKGDLRGSSATSTKQPDAGQQSAPATKTGPEIYYVRGPGSISRSISANGRAPMRVLIPAGELVELTEEEAAGYGDAVVLGTPPPPPTAISARKAGRYRVAGPGKVKHGGGVGADGKYVPGVFHVAGTVLNLTEEDARSLGASVVEAV